jgi:hypothetical protein
VDRRRGGDPVRAGRDRQPGGRAAALGDHRDRGPGGRRAGTGPGRGAGAHRGTAHRRSGPRRGLGRGRRAGGPGAGGPRLRPGGGARRRPGGARLGPPGQRPGGGARAAGPGRRRAAGRPRRPRPRDDHRPDRGARRPAFGPRAHRPADLAAGPDAGSQHHLGAVECPGRDDRRPDPRAHRGFALLRRPGPGAGRGRRVPGGARPGQLAGLRHRTAPRRPPAAGPAPTGAAATGRPADRVPLPGGQQVPGGRRGLVRRLRRPDGGHRRGDRRRLRPRHPGGDHDGTAAHDGPGGRSRGGEDAGGRPRAGRRRHRRGRAAGLRDRAGRPGRPARPRPARRRPRRHLVLGGTPPAAARDGRRRGPGPAGGRRPDVPTTTTPSPRPTPSCSTPTAWSSAGARTSTSGCSASWTPWPSSAGCPSTSCATRCSGGCRPTGTTTSPSSRSGSAPEVRRHRGGRPRRRPGVPPGPGTHLPARAVPGRAWGWVRDV